MRLEALKIHTRPCGVRCSRETLQVGSGRLAAVTKMRDGPDQWRSHLQKVPGIPDITYTINILKYTIF
jgi:hypothetical protein